MGVGKGGQGEFWPPLNFEIWHFPIKFAAKKGCFLGFEWEKWNFTTFVPLKISYPGKIHYCSPWKKSFRRSCTRPAYFETRHATKEVNIEQVVVLGEKCRKMLFITGAHLFFVAQLSFPKCHSVAVSALVLVEALFVPQNTPALLCIWASNNRICRK